MSIQTDSADFWDAHPCNARRGRVADGEKTYFQDIRANKVIVEPHLMPFMERDRWNGKTVLDVGCGIGTQAVLFAEAGAWITATDFSLDSLALAERHRDSAEWGEAFQSRMILRKLDYDRDIYPRHHFDLIWAWGSLHHMQTPARNLRALRAHCAGTNTTLKLMVYHRQSLKVWRLMAIHGDQWRKWTEADGPVPVSNAYRLSSAIAMVELAGWQVTSARVTHIFPWSVKHYNKRKFVKAFPWNVVPARAFRWLEDRYGFHILITAVPR
jgi:2-polyprenyl-3-methyl-5-hydroxy-6-metoxy-1,4-benzoquinol methylase